MARGEADLLLHSDELLLPHMKRVDGMITDNRRRLLPKLCMGQIVKVSHESAFSISSSVYHVPVQLTIITTFNTLTNSSVVKNIFM